MHRSSLKVGIVNNAARVNTMSIHACENHHKRSVTGNAISKVTNYKYINIYTIVCLYCLLFVCP